MKKILFLLILAYSYSFSWSTYQCGANLSFINSGPVLSGPYWTPYEGCQRNYYKSDVTVTYGGLAWSISLYSGTGSPACNSTLEMSDGIMTCTEDNKLGEFIPNPDPNGGSTCRELFQKDGVAYNCNPNTNESAPIENSDGLIEDEEGNEYPKCNDGYDYAITQNGMSNTTGTDKMYNSYSCEQITNSEDGNNEENPNTFPDAPTTSTGADGSTTWTWGDGTTQTLSPNGTLTTYYPDGTISVKQTGNDYDPTTGGSSGGSATGGTGGAGTNGNTTNETDTPNNNDTPIDDTPASNSCSDSSLTLQEKMLCEMNAGMKKLNSESNTQNSLNNLLKDLNTTSNTNATAINTNLKNTNTSLTGIKSLNENQLAEQKKTNDKLRSVENGVDGTNLLLGAANTKLEQIRDNIKELPEGSESFVDSITNSTNAMNDAYNGFSNFLNDMKSSYNNLLSQFDDAKSTFQIGLTFNPIQNIVNSSNLEQCLTVSVFGGNEVFLDFITPLLYIKPITTLIIQIFMLVEVVRMCFRIFDYVRGIL